MSGSTERRTSLAAFGLLAGLAAPHAFGAILDMATAIHFPFELAYGEGVVLVQAGLIAEGFGYQANTELPFIVFHYPPIYHLLVLIVRSAVSDGLVAGRIVTAISTMFLALIAGWSVISATGRKTGVSAVLAGLFTAFLLLGHPNIRACSVLMRVDMTANALGLAGVLVACRARLFLGHAVTSLLLCTLAVFTKQTEILSLIAASTTVLLRAPRLAIIAGTIVGSAGLVACIGLQIVTDGGFLLHIITYNLNRFDWLSGVSRIRGEQANLALIAVITAAAVILGLQFRYRAFKTNGQTVTESMLILFVLNLFTIAGMWKSGASFNYLNMLYCSGAVLVGIALYRLLRSAFFTRCAGFCLTLILAAWISGLPFERLPYFLELQSPAVLAELETRIAEAGKPVLSDDMVLLIKAHSRAVVEPAIVTELAAMGLWDETPLLQFIAGDGFAFVISEGESFADARHSAAVQAGLEGKFPLARQVTRRLWLHLPGKSSF